MRGTLTTATRIAFLAVAAGVVVQVFLAGLAIFGTDGFDTHKGVGWMVHTISLLALLLAIAGPRTREAMIGALVLAVLNTVQILVSTADGAAVAALHPTLALAVLGYALWLSRAVGPAAPSAPSPR